MHAALALATLMMVTPADGTRADTLRRVLLPAGDAARLEDDGYDVLASGPDGVEVIVSAREMEALRRSGAAVTVLGRGRPLREILAGRRGPARPGGVPDGYPDLDAVETAMASAAAAYPSICRVVDLTATLGMPPTFEGRHLLAMKISDNVADDEDEPALLVVGAHHAREVVTPVIALHAIDQLTSLYTKDEAVTAAVDDHEIWIAPVWNPDGYAYVFDVDNTWRKNRRDLENAVGVDLNRNYPFGWTSKCAGSGDPKSNTYRGPDAASEPEVQTMIAWSLDRHFAKVIDYHSAGREALWGYRCIFDHPFGAYLEAEAADLSTSSGYGGATRPPSADGEHYQWQLGARGAHAFLVETAEVFQPPYEDALAEAALVFPGVLDMIGRPIPLRGTVRDAVTGLPVVANVALAGAAFMNGETNTSDGRRGRFHLFAPAGNDHLRITAAGYLEQSVPVTVVAGVSTLRDVVLTPLDFVGDVNRDGVVDFSDVILLLSAWGPCAPPGACPADFDGDGIIGFADLLALLGGWSWSAPAVAS